MTNSHKLSARRFGRLLSVLSLRAQNYNTDDSILESFYNTILNQFDQEDMLRNVSPVIKSQIFRFAKDLINGVETKREQLILQISQRIKGRPWNRLTPLEQTLLLIGAYDLEVNTSTPPKIIIKEILMISDALGNEKSAPMLSGVLKTIAFGALPDSRAKSVPKIRLKRNI